LHVAIFDDIFGQRMDTVRTLKEIDCVSNIASFDSTDSLLESFVHNSYDVIILETRTHSTDGIEAAQLIRNMDSGIDIIFVTNSSGYFREAFSVYATDYILKPVDSRKIEKTLRRILEKIKVQNDKVIEIKRQNIIYRIRQNDIILIEKEANRCMVYTDQITFDVVVPLKYFEDVLDEKKFVRSHAGFLVNIGKITSIESDGNLKSILHFKDIEKTAILSRGKRQYIFNKSEGWCDDDKVVRTRRFQ
jgi:DNA-binding LytR/AlgR family response regulator